MARKRQAEEEFADESEEQEETEGLPEEEVDSNLGVERLKGDLAPMQPTGMAVEQEEEEEEGEQFIVARGRLGQFRYGQKVTAARLGLKDNETELRRHLREGNLSRVEGTAAKSRKSEEKQPEPRKSEEERRAEPRTHR